MDPWALRLLLFAGVLAGNVSSFAVSSTEITTLGNDMRHRKTSRQSLGSPGRICRTSVWSTPATNAEEPVSEELLDRSLRNCQSSRQARQVIKNALSTKGGSDSDEQACKNPRSQKVLFDSVSIPPGAAARGVSDGDLAIQARLVNSKYKLMELVELTGDRDADRASLAILCLTVGSSLSAIAVNQSLPGPEIIRFLIVWLLSFAPLIFVGYGIATPTKLQALLVSIQRELFPAYRQRMIQHEAGHFLMAHLLGLPIEGYRANAVKNAVQFFPLKDSNLGQDRAQLLGFDRPSSRDDESITNWLEPDEESSFFGPGGRGAEIVERQSVFRNAKNYTDNPFLKLPSSSEPSEAWPFRGFDERTIDQLSVVSVAGVCAEILAFGNAEGGLADLSQLRQIFASAEEEMDEREVDNRIRFAMGYTISQLRLHLGALDALASVMGRDGSIAECVLAIEHCPNISGQDGIMGDYELRRREAFRIEKAGIFEKIFLGGEKSIDQKEDRMVTGKGGGYRKEVFRLTGDDPLYLAGGLALAFALWASSGGLSLH